MKRVPYQFAEWMLSTSVFMALCAIALCLATEKMLLSYLPPLMSPLHALIVGSTLIEYNVHHLFNSRYSSGESWSGHAQKWHWGMAIGGGVLCIAAVPFLKIPVIIACGALGLFALAYSTPLLPFKYKRRLKDYGIIKISVLTISWVVATTALPAIYWGLPFRYLWLEVACRLLLIFPLCLAFDIRDVINDSEIGIDTVPTAIGTERTYRLIDISLLLLIAEGFFQYLRRDEPFHLASVVLCAVAAWLAVRYSRKHPHPFVFLGLVDGVMLLYGVLGMV